MEATRVRIAEAAKCLSELVNLKDLGVLEEKDLTMKLAALERAKAVSERIRAEREARRIQDVDSVEILRELRQEHLDEVTGMC